MYHIKKKLGIKQIFGEFYSPLELKKTNSNEIHAMGDNDKLIVNIGSK